MWFFNIFCSVFVTMPNKIFCSWLHEVLRISDSEGSALDKILISSLLRAREHSGRGIRKNVKARR